MTRSVWLLLASLSLLAAGDGCPQAPVALACDDDGDCPSGAVCGPGGICVAVAEGEGEGEGEGDPFPFNPTHFVPSDYLPGPSVVVSCGLDFNTDIGQFFGTCAPTGVSVALISQAGAPQIRVLAVDDLEIRPGARLNVFGSRALLIAAYNGPVIIDGTLDVSAAQGSAGAGGGDGRQRRTDRAARAWRLYARRWRHRRPRRQLLSFVTLALLRRR